MSPDKAWAVWAVTVFVLSWTSAEGVPDQEAGVGEVSVQARLEKKKHSRIR